LVNNLSFSGKKPQGLTMSQVLRARLTNRIENSVEYYEVAVNIPGVRPTKLVRKSDDSSRFATRSAAVNAARSFSKTFGFSDINLVDGTKTLTTTA
jgi:hypothetical protein